jgi:hypothetical protein
MHPSSSCTQLATVPLPAHVLATDVHTASALHVHCAAPPVVVHVWRDPQVFEFAHCVQPFDWVVHV